MAGISAAKTLALDFNISDFLVVEARHEIGGRMQNVRFGKDKSYSVELGANWYVTSCFFFFFAAA